MPGRLRIWLRALFNRAWRTHFRSDSSIIGKSVSLGGRRPWQVVGVMPDKFTFPAPSTDVYLPMLWDRNEPNNVAFRRAHYIRVVARLKHGVSLQAASASLQTVVKRLEAQYPATNTRMGAGLTPLHDGS